MYLSNQSYLVLQELYKFLLKAYYVAAAVKLSIDVQVHACTCTCILHI